VNILDVLHALDLRDVIACAEAHEAVERTRAGISVVVVDTTLPDSGAVAVVSAAVGTTPVPVLIAVDAGAPRRALFALAALGVDGFLEVGFSAQELCDCLSRAADTARLRRVARTLVGTMSLRDAQHEIRETMLREALVASAGSRRRAAKLRGVTRPAVQRMLRESYGDSVHAPELPTGSGMR
jgi:DNA-binding NtrC family response regulator